jgi:hypothetical protein
VTGDRRRRLALALLCAGALALRGDTCAAPVAPGPLASLEVEAGDAWAFGAGYFQEVHLRASTGTTDFVQAFDFELSWDPNVVTWAAAFPHAEFDQDGAFFDAPVLETDRISGVVDLRHGAGASGSFRIATFYLWAPLGGKSKVTAKGDLAGPTGELFNIVVTNVLVIHGPAGS